MDPLIRVEKNECVNPILYPIITVVGDGWTKLQGFARPNGRQASLLGRPERDQRVRTK
jgi:hypothetical protein